MSDSDDEGLTQRGAAKGDAGSGRIESAKKFLWDEDEMEDVPAMAVTGEANLHSGGSGHGYGNDGFGGDYFDKRGHRINPVVAGLMGTYHVIVGFCSLLGEKLCTPVGRKISLAILAVTMVIVVVTQVTGGEDSLGGLRISKTRRYELAYEKVKSWDIVGTDVLKGPKTAHHNALLWIAGHDESYIDPAHPEFMSRYMLAVLYFSTKGKDTPHDDGKTHLPFRNWMSGEGVCHWKGISCVPDKADKHGHGPIKKIDIKESELEGTIPSGLYSLQSLAVLDVSSNKLTGTIPHTLFNSNALEDVFLRINNFSGPLPIMVHNYCKLRQLFVDYSKFRNGQVHYGFWAMFLQCQFCLCC